MRFLFAHVDVAVWCDPGAHGAEVAKISTPPQWDAKIGAASTSASRSLPYPRPA